MLPTAPGARGQKWKPPGCLENSAVSQDLCFSP